MLTFQYPLYLFTYNSLNIFNLASLALTLLFSFLFIFYYTRNFKFNLTTKNNFKTILKKLSELEPQKNALLNDIDPIFQETQAENLTKAWKKMKQYAFTKFNQRFFPPAKDYFNLSLFAFDDKKQNLSYHPIKTLLLGGCSFSCILCLIHIFIKPTLKISTEYWWFLPFGALLILSLLLYTQIKISRKEISAQLDTLCSELGSILPQYSAENETALLVNHILVHDEKIEQTLTSFEETCKNLLEKDLIDSIAQIFETNLKEHLLPEINHSLESLQTFSDTLIETQQTGMSTMAKNFSQALTSDLQKKIEPLTQQFQEFNGFIQQSEERLKPTIEIFAAAQKQNEKLEQHLEKLLVNLSLLNNDLANELAAIKDNMLLMNEISERILSVYTNDDNLLNKSISALSQQVKLHGMEISATMQETTQAHAGVQKIQEESMKKLDQYLLTSEQHNKNFMNQSEQVGKNFIQASQKISRQLDTTYTNLQETLKVDLEEKIKLMQTEKIFFEQKQQAQFEKTQQLFQQNLKLWQNSLFEISQYFEKNKQDFASQSDIHVKRTLQQFDEGLGDVISRLTYTMAEIRDAIDYLPKVLRPDLTDEKE